MQLSSGARIGSYEITGTLGAGGMGEVYRARDSKLGRSVAIKVLSPALANDADYIARFEREAQVLASLNHPSIAQIYGLEAGAIVMELVEGPTLAERIAQGPVPLDEAIPIAIQIAEALEAAHEQGIVHRDLKPANIKLTADGRVKVLDFGLAKAADVVANAATANSPTLTLRTAAVGTILGTAGYMAPEQAAGKPVDRRADIWAFGVVLWEMLTGRRLFDGETVSHTLADVLRAPIELDAAPASMRPLVARCLDREVKTRLQWIGEARIALARPEPVRVHAQRSRWPLPVTAAACLLAALAGWGWYSAIQRPDVDRPLLRFKEFPGGGLVLRDGRGPTPYSGPSTILSRDGKRFVFVASAEGRPPQLYTRRIEESAAKPIEGTEGASTPFFSPDGRWVGYVAGGKLYKAAVDGGTRVALCDVSNSFGASWGDNGVIVFSAELRGGLLRVSDRGGVPQPLTKVVETRENTHRWPQVLPGGKAVLFSAGMGGSFSEGTVEVQRLDTGERRTVVSRATFGRYLPSGHLTYVANGTLFATEFDPEALQTKNEAVPILQNVRVASDAGGAQFDFSDDGLAVFRSGSDIARGQLSLIASDGKIAAFPGLDGGYVAASWSPDGRRVAVIRQESEGSQIWVADQKTGVRTRLTFETARYGRPMWTPDGQRIVYSDNRGIYWTRADGSGKPVRLLDQPGTVAGMTPDAKTLVFNSQACWAVNIDGDPERPAVGKPYRCYGDPIRPVFMQLSPDGRWLAYSTPDRGTTSEIFVRPFPDRGGRWQVSAGGGMRPEWSRNTPELFYVSTTDELLSVPYKVSGDSFSAGTPRRWPVQRPISTTFAVAPDARSVLVPIPPESSGEREPDLEVLLNFFDEVRRRINGDRR